MDHFKDHFFSYHEFSPREPTETPTPVATGRCTAPKADCPTTGPEQFYRQDDGLARRGPGSTMGEWVETHPFSHHGSVDSKKSPTGPTERTPKPENLLALATSLGVRW